MNRVAGALRLAARVLARQQGVQGAVLGAEGAGNCLAYQVRGGGAPLTPSCDRAASAFASRIPVSRHCIVEAGDAMGWERLNLGPHCSWPACGCQRGRAAEQRRVAGPCVCRLQPCAWAGEQPGARASLLAQQTQPCTIS